MNRTANKFSQSAEFYTERAVIQRWLRDELLERLGKTKGNWLDVGCGPMVQNLGSTCYGIDLARFPNKSHIQACTERLPLAKNSVDGIFSNMALQWCEQPLNAIEEWHRVCKPGARVALTVTCDGNFGELMSAYLGCGLPCPVQPTLPATAWAALFRTHFQLEHQHVHSYQLLYNNIQQLMTHIKETGASTPNRDSGIRSAGALRNLEAQHPKDAHGRLPLTYKVVCLIGRKQ